MLNSNGLKSPIKSHRLIDETSSKILHIYDAKQSLRSIRKFKVFLLGHKKSKQLKLLKINESMELKQYTFKWPIGPRKNQIRNKKISYNQIKMKTQHRSCGVQMKVVLTEKHIAVSSYIKKLKRF